MHLTPIRSYWAAGSNGNHFRTQLNLLWNGYVHHGGIEIFNEVGIQSHTASLMEETGFTTILVLDTYPALLSLISTY